MRAGRMDTLVQLQVNTPGDDGMGGITWSWAKVEDIWANVRPLRAKERFQADRTVAVEALVFTVRYKSGVTVKHRIVHDGKNYDIKGIAEVEREHWLEITAELVE